MEPVFGLEPKTSPKIRGALPTELQRAESIRPRVGSGDDQGYNGSALLSLDVLLDFSGVGF